jgi:biotin synthase
MDRWINFASQVIDGYRISRDEARDILNTKDLEILSLLNGAFILRKQYHGLKVRIHVLKNAKSGMCPEDCSFCSQARGAESGVDRYSLLSVEQLVEGAHRAAEAQAVKYCMVTSTRGPSAREINEICTAVQRIKAELPHLRICTSLGLLTDHQAEQLAAAGVDRFNHNLETSKRFYPSICSTHSYEDRVSTVRAAKRAGMEACCGGIMGMGETDDDRIELAFALRDLEVDSIPINFLDPRPGTPLQEVSRLKPLECLRLLAMFRFVNPTRDIRVAGGREINLRSLQPLALYAANSIFADGYLTTGGQGHEADLQLIEDLGFEVAINKQD